MTTPRVLRTTALAIALVLTPVAAAADGDLDFGFGTGGVVVTTVSGAQLTPSSLVVQPDGKYIVAGQLLSAAGGQFAVVRYQPNGSIDTSFGDGGFATTGFGTLGAIASAIALSPDGDVVVGGTSFDFATGPTWALARFNADGALDSAFGTGGKRLFAFAPGSMGGIHDLALDASGKIVATGGGPGFPATGIGVARFLGDGSLDTSFGDVGRSVVAFDDDLTVGGDLALDRDGNLLVSGQTGGGTTEAFVARLTPDGALDATFAIGGRTILPLDGFFNSAGTMTVTSDGGVLVIGRTFSTGPSSVVARLSPDGSVDTSFGGDGVVAVPVAIAARALVQADGKVIVVGTAGDPLFAQTQFAAVRLTPDGATDTSFGNGGAVITAVGPDAHVVDGAIAGGGVTLAGRITGSGVLARYTIATNVPFASFAPRATLGAGTVDLRASFALGDASNGIEPAVEGIAIGLGPHAALVEGASLREGVGGWKYEGPLFGASADLQLVETAEGAYELKLVLTDVPFSLAAPLEVKITIGDDEGSAVARLDD